MDKRERFVIYPLMLLSVGFVAREKFSRPETLEADRISCRQIVVEWEGKSVFNAFVARNGNSMNVETRILTLLGNGRVLSLLRELPNQPAPAENNGSADRVTEAVDGDTPTSTSSDPANPNPAATEDPATRDTPTDPANSTPTPSEPTKTEPAAPEPEKGEPEPSDPAKTGPAAAQPEKPEPAKIPRAKAEPTKAEPAASEPAATPAEPDTTSQPDKAADEPPGTSAPARQESGRSDAKGEARSPE